LLTKYDKDFSNQWLRRDIKEKLKMHYSILRQSNDNERYAILDMFFSSNLVLKLKHENDYSMINLRALCFLVMKGIYDVNYPTGLTILTEEQEISLIKCNYDTLIDKLVLNGYDFITYFDMLNGNGIRFSLNQFNPNANFIFVRNYSEGVIVNNKMYYGNIYDYEDMCYFDISQKCYLVWVNVVNEKDEPDSKKSSELKDQIMKLCGNLWLNRLAYVIRMILSQLLSDRSEQYRLEYGYDLYLPRVNFSKIHFAPNLWFLSHLKIINLETHYIMAMQFMSFIKTHKYIPTAILKAFSTNTGYDDRCFKSNYIECDENKQEDNTRMLIQIDKNRKTRKYKFIDNDRDKIINDLKVKYNSDPRKLSDNLIIDWLKIFSDSYDFFSNYFNVYDLIESIHQINLQCNEDIFILMLDDQIKMSKTKFHEKCALFRSTKLIDAKLIYAIATAPNFELLERYNNMLNSYGKINNLTTNKIDEIIPPMLLRINSTTSRKFIKQTMELHQLSMDIKSDLYDQEGNISIRIKENTKYKHIISNRSIPSEEIVMTLKLQMQSLIYEVYLHLDKLVALYPDLISYEIEGTGDSKVYNFKCVSPLLELFSI